MTIKEPDVQAEDNAAAQEQAETMLSGPVTLTRGEKKWTLDVEQLVAYMDFRAEEQGGVSTLVPYISADKMGPFFDDIAAQVATKPANATFASDGNTAWVVPGVLEKRSILREPRRLSRLPPSRPARERPRSR